MFRLPRALLKIIRPIELQIKITTPSFADSGHIDKGPACIVRMLLAAVEDIYRENMIPREEKERILEAVLEALANASEHGNKSDKEKNIILGCWFGRQGIAFSIRDEGNFFTKRKSKKAIESRTPLPSERIEQPGGEGCLTIYKADKLSVSTGQNTLYFAFKRHNA